MSIAMEAGGMHLPSQPGSFSVPYILFVDAYDSFTNNIVGLLEKTLEAHVTLVHIDDPIFSAAVNSGTAGKNAVSSLEDLLAPFSAVVIGPGPGDPTNPDDVGFIDALWRVAEKSLLPVLGVCLGFQSLGCAFGGEVKKLQRPRHGIVKEAIHQGSDIFKDVGKVQAVGYHSLRIELGHGSSCLDEGLSSSDTGGMWLPTSKAPELVPLSWDTSDPTDGAVLMAMRHRHKPFWGVQFHPESICTSSEGQTIVQRWWELARQWLIENNRPPNRSSPWASALGLSRSSDEDHALPKIDFPCQDGLTCSPGPVNRSDLLWSTFPLDGQSTPDICEALGVQSGEAILLDSQGHQSGRFSILGLMVPESTTKLNYTARNHQIVIHKGGIEQLRLTLETPDQVWQLLEGVLQFYRPQNTENLPHETPFWGGWMGYISYEAGLQSLRVDIPKSSVSESSSDFNMAFIQRSVVVDSEASKVYVQSLIEDDEHWVENTSLLIKSLARKSPASASPASSCEVEAALSRSQIHRPAEPTYRSSVLDCQSFLAAGESYELCLTDETRITTPSSLSPWQLYRRLRSSNPAPFGAYLRLSGAALVGSSPERFLRWTRDGICQLRPIKGTVRKGNGMTRERAHAILNTSKERAENLMIVDLIRHDLSGVVGAKNCEVTQLMQVEEYQTVYQLVSVIEGRLPQSSNANPVKRRKIMSEDEPSETLEKPALVLPAPTGDYFNYRPGSRTPPLRFSASSAFAALSRSASASPALTLDSDSGCSSVSSVFSSASDTQAKLPGSSTSSPTGINVLRASLPPGSMTGAPKKRSCEILAGLEKRPRGVYAGVLGYMDVGGGGDMSVVIRTAFSWDADLHKEVADDAEGTEEEWRTWRVGAGGAVTIQSTDEGEFEEMETKLDSVLRSFGVQS